MKAKEAVRNALLELGNAPAEQLASFIESVSMAFASRPTISPSSWQPSKTARRF